MNNNKDLFLILIILIVFALFLTICYNMGGTESGRWYNGEIACVLMNMVLL